MAELLSCLMTSLETTFSTHMLDILLPHNQSGGLLPILIPIPFPFPSSFGAVKFSSFLEAEARPLPQERAVLPPSWPKADPILALCKSSAIDSVPPSSAIQYHAYAFAFVSMDQLRYRDCLLWISLFLKVDLGNPYVAFEALLPNWSICR